MNAENTTRSVSPRVIKEINVFLIQSCIYKKGPISRIDIAAETNSSVPTVSRAVDVLLKKNIVKTVGIIKSTGAGRKAELIDFNYSYGSVIGLHIQEQHIQIALCDLKGRIIQKGEIPLAHDKDSFLSSILDLINGVLKNKSAGKLLTVSVACPGLVDFKSGKIERSIDIPLLKELLLKEELESHYNVPVCIDNDVNIASLGEYSFYKTKNIHNLAYIEFGPGIGAGVIINGELYRGHGSGAGELGYCLFDEADLYEDHLDKGSFSESINLNAVEGEIRKIAEAEYPALSGAPYQLLLSKILEMYTGGDARACALVDGVIDRIAMAVCNYSCVLNPELIVIDGDFVNAWGEILLKKVRRALEMSYPLVPEIKTTRSGLSSKLVSAIEIALNDAAGILNLHGVSFYIN